MAYSSGSLLLRVLEAGKSRVEVPADLVGGEAHFLVQRWQTPSLSPRGIRDEGALWAL